MVAGSSAVPPAAPTVGPHVSQSVSPGGSADGPASAPTPASAPRAPADSSAGPGGDGNAHLRSHVANAGGGVIRALPSPHLPSAEEVARHNVDHCPYQSWCRSCVAGCGKADSHFRRESDDLKIPCVSCDYCFMGESVEEERMCERCLPILVHKFFQIGG